MVAVVVSGVIATAMSGCADPPSAPAGSATVTTSPSAAPAAAPLPGPDELTTVLSRLMDPNVPVTEKITLVEYATPDDGGALDKFGRALADNGYAPLTFEARDITWSDSSEGDVVATVVIKPASTKVGSEFTFPMEFSPSKDGWQLTRRTADLLLAIGDEADVSPVPPPPPPATPPR